METVLARMPSTGSKPWSSASSSSSMTNLSKAFSSATAKRSPRLSAAHGQVEASTANGSDNFILQPKQTSENPHDMLSNGVNSVTEGTKSSKSQESLQQIARSSQTRVNDVGIVRILNDPYAKGNHAKASEVVDILDHAEQGIIEPIRPSQVFLGAVNREGVTCYLDSLLFTMFATIDSYEAMLLQDFEDEPRRRLALLLRLWVNLFRSGRLITTDITRQLQLALASCGWKEAAELHQQDPSEAYSFITEKLAMPMLTLQMNLYHGGKEDTESDQKLVHERVIEVPVPSQPEDGQSITLEDCLTAYFDNQVVVERFLSQQMSTLNSAGSFQLDDCKVPVRVDTMAVNESQPPTPQVDNISQDIVFPSSPSRLNGTIVRKPSIFSKRSIDPEKSDVSDLDSPTRHGNDAKGRRRGASLMKIEVKIPAFQFFSLIPWYTPSGNDDSPPSTNTQLVRHFKSHRPIVPIALKWSQMDAGRAVRRDTPVDIPLTYDMPHFTTGNNESEDPLHGHFVLVLQGFLCHRGTKPDSGHYVSAARCNNSKDGEYQWLLNDDLAAPRVSYVEDIKLLLKEEKPYLLFYQVEPISALGEPPAYSDSATTDSSVVGASTNAVEQGLPESGTDTGRNSLDKSMDEESRGRSSMTSDRRKGGIRTNFPPDEHKTNGVSRLTTEMSSDSQAVDDVSRRSSKAGQNGSTVRQPGRSTDMRSSMSLSRMTSRLTKGKSSTSLSGIDHASVENTECTTSEGVGKTEAIKTSHRKNRHPKEGHHNASDRRECALM